jgi:hypothetical protein
VILQTGTGVSHREEKTHGSPVRAKSQITRNITTWPGTREPPIVRIMTQVPCMSSSQLSFINRSMNLYRGLVVGDFINWKRKKAAKETNQGTSTPYSVRRTSLGCQLWWRDRRSERPLLTCSFSFSWLLVFFCDPAACQPLAVTGAGADNTGHITNICICTEYKHQIQVFHSLSLD